MYNRLRLRFVTFSTLIVTAILVFVSFGINLANFISDRNQEDLIISSFVVRKDAIQYHYSTPEEELEYKNSGNELRYRDEYYFVVSYINSEYNTEEYDYFVRTDYKLPQMDRDTGINYYNRAMSEKTDKGYLDNYRYLRDNNTVYFLDCAHFLDAQQDFFTISIGFSAGAIVIFFLCSFFGSALVFRSIKNNDAKQKEFITDASHQLKTPLMVISANNDLISIKNGDSDETRTISAQIEQMSSMVSTLLSISKSSEAVKTEQRVLSLSSALNEGIEMFQPLFTRENLTINCKIDDNINVLSDDYTINEIVKIVLENAVKYAKTTISIALKKEIRYVELIEINDSDFTEDEDLNYLSERFVRGEANSQDKSGSGIGLALLKTLLDNQKATLDIHSKDKNFILKIKFRSK